MIFIIKLISKKILILMRMLLDTELNSDLLIKRYVTMLLSPNKMMDCPQRLCCVPGWNMHYQDCSIVVKHPFGNYGENPLEGYLVLDECDWTL